MRNVHVPPRAPRAPLIPVVRPDSTHNSSSPAMPAGKAGKLTQLPAELSKPFDPLATVIRVPPGKPTGDLGKPSKIGA